MTTNSSKSTFRYGLVALLIIALFISAIFFYTRNNRINKLTDNINQLSQIENDYSELDTCVLVLYKADNNCRLFEATGDNKYMKQFSLEISRVSNILDSLQVKENAKPASKNIRGLVAQKRTKMQVYLKLKLLTDSLYQLSGEIDTVTQRTLLKGKEITKGNFKTIVLIDTVRSTKDIKQKNLIGRLADAFSRKNNKVDTSKSLVRKRVTLDTSLSSREYNRIQLGKINSYFNSLYAANQRLKKREIEILRINSRIIHEIVFLLQNFQKKEVSYVVAAKKDIHSDLDSTFKSINNIYTLIFLLLVALVSVILYNLWKIYTNEGKLIDYNAKADQYAQSKSRFLANMSHEIRTPLNSVIGFSEQLSQVNLPSPQKEQVEAIKTSSELLLDLVNDILDFSKYEVGKINFDKVSFSPFDAINEVMSSIGIQASRKGISLEKDISFNENLFVEGDSLRLKQVVMNLLSNAIKFTDTGSVTLKADLISISKKRSTLNVQVIDTGVGIEAKDAAVIFDEFAQVNYSTTKNTQKGTGLGLAICKKIVELQKGKISLVSTVGKGSNFMFEIPYDVCSDNTNKSKALAINDVAHLAGKKVLLVDDNKMNVLLAQTVVKKYGIITDKAFDGQEAHQLFKVNRYDLILTDVQMPIMGGIELTRLIRSDVDKTKSNTPILGVTANVLEEDRDKYIAAGINALVLKPYSEKELIDKIAGYILS